MADLVAEFQKRVADLASEQGLRFPLDEQDLWVWDVMFESEEFTTRTIRAVADQSLASRAFLQSLARNGEREVEITSDVLYWAKDFYGHYWDDRPLTGAHPYIDALKQYRRIIIHAKKD
jgi:hypothetical protein